MRQATVHYARHCFPYHLHAVCLWCIQDGSKMFHIYRMKWHFVLKTFNASRGSCYKIMHTFLAERWGSSGLLWGLSIHPGHQMAKRPAIYCFSEQGLLQTDLMSWWRSRWLLLSVEALLSSFFTLLPSWPVRFQGASSVCSFPCRGFYREIYMWNFWSSWPLTCICGWWYGDLVVYYDDVSVDNALFIMRWTIFLTRGFAICGLDASLCGFFTCTWGCILWIRGFYYTHVEIIYA